MQYYTSETKKIIVTRARDCVERMEWLGFFKEGDGGCVFSKIIANHDQKQIVKLDDKRFMDILVTT
jgi:hypothetical protein